MLAVGEVVQEEQQDQGVDPPEYGPCGLERFFRQGRQRPGKERGNRHEPRGGLLAQRYQRAVQSEVGEHEQRNGAQYQEGLSAFGAGVGGLHVVGGEEEPPAGGEDHAGKRKDRDDVKGKQQEVVQPFGKQREAPAGEKSRYQELSVRDQEHQEGPEDHCVVQAERLRHHPLLSQGVGDDPRDSLTGIVKALFLLADRNQRKSAVAAPAKEQQ